MNAVIVGRSHNVGLPIQILLGADSVKGGFDMTTTLCHRHTPVSQLNSAVSAADLLVTAAGNIGQSYKVFSSCINLVPGVPGLVHKNIIKPGAVIIDVGLNRVAGKLVGDAHTNVREVGGDEILADMIIIMYIPGCLAGDSSAGRCWTLHRGLSPAQHSPRSQDSAQLVEDEIISSGTVCH